VYPARTLLPDIQASPAVAPERTHFIPLNRKDGWIYLVLAGLFEIGWPVGLKMVARSWIALGRYCVAIVFMTISGTLLWLAQRHISIGTAHAVWMGIGAAGTFLEGICFHSDPASLARYLGVALIVLGVVTLKLAH
jgi:quaternary ammonium compound-resistance protein SugE